MKHELWCRQKALPHEDAAQRLCDVYNLHRVAGGLATVGQWFAASLAEGRSDMVLYRSKLECVRHQGHNEQYYTFIKINPSSMNACEAQVMLNTARRLYDNGLRMTDPDHAHGGPDLIKRVTAEDQLNAMQGVATNLIMPWEADT